MMHVLRRLCTLLVIVLAIPASAILWLTPLSTGYVSLDSSGLWPYTAALEAHGADPVDFVVDAFSDRDVVIVGESHRVAQDALFVQELLPEIYHRAGVRHLLIEFGRVTDQPLVDHLLKAPFFDRAGARRVLENIELSWLYEEYLGVIEAAWKLNSGLPNGASPFSVVLGTPHPDDPAGKDASMAAIAMRHVRAGHSLLVYCGTHHGFTRYRQPMPFEYFYLPNDRPGRMGNRLSSALGNRVAFIRLHAPCAKRWAFFVWPLYQKPMLLPFGGVIDRAHAALDRPVGFWTHLKPFSELTDSVSYYSLHRSPLKLSEFADGYIVLASMEQRVAVRPFPELDEAEQREVRSNGLFPERAWAKTDRAGFDESQWLPNISAFWVGAGTLAAFWFFRRSRKKNMAHAPESNRP